MASVVDGANTKQYNMTVMQGLKLASVKKTLAGTGTVLVTEPPVHYIECGGSARNYDLPAEADSVGLTFHIRNISAAANTLTVRNDAAGTILALAQNAFAIYHCDGVDWRVIG